MAEAKTTKTVKKATVTKSAVKAAKKTVKSVEPVAEKNMKPASGTISEVKKVSLKVSVVGVDGSSVGTMNLPEGIFGAKPNKVLIAQAVRVYLANQRTGTASTKNRGEVVGSTRKIYRQKGTGRARHGAVKAPIFVGGGVAFGPRPHDFSLKMPAKMKKQALISALSEKAQAGFIKVVEGEFSGKTKEMAKLLKSIEIGKKGKAEKVLLVVDNNEMAIRAAHNVGGMEIARVSTLSTYGVVVNKNIVFLKNAVTELEKKLAN